MIEAHKKFFKNYTNFSGRSTRSDYWYIVLGEVVAALLSFIMPYIGNNILEGLGENQNLILQILDIIFAFIIMLIMIIVGIYILSTTLGLFALRTRRMHDVNKSGWWLLIELVPIVGPIIFFIFSCTDSVNENNKYGKNVKNIDNNVQNKKRDIETCNKISKNNDKKDLKNNKKNKKDESESEEEDDDESDSMSLVSKLVLGSFLLIVGYSIANVYFGAKYDNNEKKLRERIEILEEENHKLTEENTEIYEEINELNSTLYNITGLHTNDYIIDKLDFFDDNIVFVLQGYGNYYYTYDCVQKITDGPYTYWAYNKEAARSKGYYKGTC